jgi:hypothetical protein
MKLDKRDRKMIVRGRVLDLGDRTGQVCHKTSSRPGNQKVWHPTGQGVFGHYDTSAIPRLVQRASI